MRTPNDSVDGRDLRKWRVRSSTRCLRSAFISSNFFLWRLLENAPRRQHLIYFEAVPGLIAFRWIFRLLLRTRSAPLFGNCPGEIMVGRIMIENVFIYLKQTLQTKTVVLNRIAWFPERIIKIPSDLDHQQQQQQQPIRSVLIVRRWISWRRLRSAQRRSVATSTSQHAQVRLRPRLPRRFGVGYRRWVASAPLLFRPSWIERENPKWRASRWLIVAIPKQPLGFR